MAVITREGIVLCDRLTLGKYTYTKGHHVDKNIVDTMWPYVKDITIIGDGRVLQSHDDIYIVAENGNTSNMSMRSKRNTVLVENNSPTNIDNRSLNYIKVVSGIVLIGGCLYLFLKNR